MRWRVRLGYPVAVVYLPLASPTPHWIARGAALAGFGLIIRARPPAISAKIANSPPPDHTRVPAIRSILAALSGASDLPSPGIPGGPAVWS